MSIYSKKSVYNNLINPKVKEIEDVCNQEKIPYFMTFATENEIKKTQYTTVTSGVDLNNPLSEDKITNYINVMNGFTTIPNTNSKECYEDELENVSHIPQQKSIVKNTENSNVIKSWDDAESLSLL